MKLNKSLLRKLPVLMVFLMVLFFLINSASAEDNLESQQSIQKKTDADKNLGGRFSIYGDLGGKINPRGLAFWAASNIGTLTITMQNMMPLGPTGKQALISE